MFTIAVPAKLSKVPFAYIVTAPTKTFVTVFIKYGAPLNTV